jgi:hypothetical protein
VGLTICFGSGLPALFVVLHANIDGYNMLDYFSGTVKDSPRHEFWYVNDDGQIVAARYDDWKVVFLENRGEAFGVWREPFTELRVPLIFHRSVRESAAQRHCLQRLVPGSRVCRRSDPGSRGEVSADDEGPSAEPVAGLFQPPEDRRAVEGGNKLSTDHNRGPDVFGWGRDFVCLWHLADINSDAEDVRFRG